MIRIGRRHATTNGDEDEDENKNKKRWWCSKRFIFLCIALLVGFIIGAVLRPKKPRFVLLEATVFTLNVSETNLVTSKFQVTIRSSNPNDYIGVYYDHLVLYASFQDQQITHSSRIPFTYQDANGATLWSSLVSGDSIPIATFIGTVLNQDQMTWNLPILFEIDGSIKWKGLPFPPMSYHIHVNCPANVVVRNSNAGLALNNNVVKYQIDQSCTISL